MAGAPTSNAEDELARARDLGVDTCGRIAEFWGFTRTMGRAFGLLYLSRQPLPQSEIQARLGISAGSASMTLAALQRWGVVHRVWVRGQRREHYQSETDFWKMISGVLNERERREIGAAVEAVARAVEVARAAGEAAPKRHGAEVTFTVDRLERLHDICALGGTMLDMLLGQLTLDVGKFRDVLRVAPPPAPVEAAPTAERTNRNRTRRSSSVPTRAPRRPKAPTRGAAGRPRRT